MAALSAGEFRQQLLRLLRQGAGQRVEVDEPSHETRNADRATERNSTRRRPRKTSARKKAAPKIGTDPTEESGSHAGDDGDQAGAA